MSKWDGMKRLRRTFRRWHARLLHPVSAAKITNALDALAVASDHALVMHSSLSNCGYIHGGPATVIELIRNRSPLLCLPTHSFAICFPDETTGNVPVFDVARTSSCVGALTEYFRRLPGVVRSVCPTHSLAALGEDAESLVQGHEDCATPCGAGTPYWKLMQRDAAALLFGAYRYTFYHTAEDAAGCAYMYYPEPVQYRIVDRDGRERTIRMKRQNMTIKRRFRQVYPDLEAAGLLRRTRLGRGEVAFIPSTQAVHKFLLEQIAKNPFYLVREECVEAARQAAGGEAE